MGGRFLIDRNIFDSSLWEDTAKFRTFFYILGKAAFKDTKIGDIELKRGQYLRSYRNLAKDLSFKENRCYKEYSMATLKRKIDMLVKEKRLEIKETDSGTLFTVKNYDKYQCFEDVEKITWNSVGTVLEQQRNNNGTITKQEELSLMNYNEVEEESPLTPQGEDGADEMKGESLTVEKMAQDTSQEDSHSKTRKTRQRKSTGILSKKQQEWFEQFWQSYPKKKSSGQAEKTFSKICTDDSIFEKIMEGLDRAKKYDSRFTDGRNFTPYPSTWLNAKGWLDCFDTERPVESNKKIGDDENGEKSEQKPDPYEAIGSIELW